MLNNLTQSARVPGQAVRRRGHRRVGKTTQLALLAKWLSAEGHRVFVTEWNSSALVKAATRDGKKKNALTPMTFSLLHATDFADRLLYKIIPPLKAGMIVLADRYAYTAFARDATRGVDRQWVRELYSFAVRPDLALYFRVPIDVSVGPAAGPPREAEVLRRRAWIWGGAPTRSRASACSRAKCSTSMIRSCRSSDGSHRRQAQHHRAAAAREAGHRAAHTHTESGDPR
jgi:hypothetical protein